LGITWSCDSRNVYAQNVCKNGGIGNCNNPIAIIEADKLSGIIPVTIRFDGSESFDPDGTIIRWEWDLGDGNTSAKAKLTHTYDKPGTYNVTLRVKDNDGRWSAKAEETVRVFSPGSLGAKIEFDSEHVKADGKGLAYIYATCHENSSSKNKKHAALSDKPPNRKASLMYLSGSTIMSDLGLYFTTTSGTLQKKVSFDPSTGYYSQYLLSGKVGQAKASAIVDGYVLATETIEFAWPLPPANVTVEMKENRSLLQGEYYAYLSWTENPQEVFTPAKYRVYRSTDGGVFELAGEVDAENFSYIDPALPAGHRYVYAVSMVDSDKDESSLSAPVTANR